MPRFDHRYVRAIAAAVLLMTTAPDTTLASEKKRTLEAPTFLELPPLTATIIRPDGGRGVLTVNGGLDVPDSQLRERAALSTPRLLNAYTQWLRQYGSALSPGRPPDVELMGRELQAATDRTLGKRGARFLFGAVLVN